MGGGAGPEAGEAVLEHQVLVVRVQQRHRGLPSRHHGPGWDILEQSYSGNTDRVIMEQYREL